MSIEDFLQSLNENNAPAGLDPILVALWKVGKGDWDSAHSIVQDLPGMDASWIHAYLHRIEGDEFNASYWYRKAGKPVSLDSPDQEWIQIVTTLIEEL